MALTKSLRAAASSSSLVVILILVLSVIYSSCEAVLDDNDKSLNESGIEGTVLRGPMCPVIREDDPCPDQPFSALFYVFNNEGAKVATFQTDEQGEFRVDLSPGEYTIIPDESAPIIFPTRQTKDVTVNSGSFTKVTLIFDTGIR